MEVPPICTTTGGEEETGGQGHCVGVLGKDVNVQDAMQVSAAYFVERREVG